MIDIFIDFLDYCLQFLYPSSLFLLTDSSESEGSDSPDRSGDCLYTFSSQEGTENCLYSFSSQEGTEDCLYNLIRSTTEPGSGLLGSLVVSVTKSYWVTTAGPLLTLFRQLGDAPHLTAALVAIAVTAWVVKTVTSSPDTERLRTDVETLEGKQRGIYERIERVEGNHRGVYERIESIEGGHRGLYERIESIDGKQREIDERIESIEEVNVRRNKKVSQNNREQIDQIRREILQLSEPHRSPKGDEEENKIKLRRIEERLPEFEKQIMLFTNVKEELRKITANYSYLLRKFEKYDENIKNHDNVNNSLKGNEKYHSEKFKTNIRNSEHLDQQEMDSQEKEKYLRENLSGNLVENLLKGNLNLIFSSKKSSPPISVNVVPCPKQVSSLHGAIMKGLIMIKYLV